jgi:plasmid stabilization system protein ParE
MTKYSILFTPEANDDLTDILGWYKMQLQEDLHRRFITNISETLKALEKSPKMYSIRLKNARCAIVRRFPFNVYYWVDDMDKTVNIFALLHQSRHPNTWQKRI